MFHVPFAVKRDSARPSMPFSMSSLEAARSVEEEKMRERRSISSLQLIRYIFDKSIETSAGYKNKCGPSWAKLSQATLL